MSKHIRRSVSTAALSALVVAGGVSAAVPSHAAPAPAANAFGAFTPMAAQAGAVSITDIAEGPGTATITWSAPLGGSPITDYEVEVGHYPDSARDDFGGTKATSSGRVDSLSDSGAPVAALAGLASVLLLAGAGGLALARRRQQQG